MIFVNKIYSYIVAEDNGYSPNPFWGVLTLPWCKPTMRKAVAKYYQENQLSPTTKSGIWLVGLSRKDKSGHNRLIYIANIDELLTHNEYFHAYPQKHPKMDQAKEAIYHVGDNCYSYDESATFGHRTLESLHSNDEAMKKRDLSSPYVLLSHNFIYYGHQAPPIPNSLEELRVGQGFKSNFSSETLMALQEYLKQELTKPTLVVAAPMIWPKDDLSWKQTII